MKMAGSKDLLVAESGSGKTDWRLVTQSGEKQEFASPGINPIHQEYPEIMAGLSLASLPDQLDFSGHLFFYGAGCIDGQPKQRIHKALETLFPKAAIEVEDDLMAAARATLGKQNGIACILGTGSNSGLFDGKKIIERIPALGYILGDEGSGAVLGRKLINAFFKKDMPQDLVKSFLIRQPFQMDEILHKVYREKNPNRFLAGFTYFLSENLDHPWIHDFLLQEFLEFIQKNICKYPGYKNLPITFTGSVAFVFAEILREAMQENKLECEKIIARPVDSLVQFHLK